MARLASPSSGGLKRYDESGAAAAPGLEFTEHMAGYFALGASDVRSGWTDGKRQRSTMHVLLTIHIRTLEGLLRDPEHRAEITGTVDCRALSAHPLTVASGEFRLFAIDRDQVGTREMRYTMELSSVEGARYAFRGRKDVRDDPGFDVWADTTTLAVNVFAADSAEAADGAPIGRGILRIRIGDLVPLVASMRTTNAHGMLKKTGVVASFGRFFGRTLLDTYGGVFARADVQDCSIERQPTRELALPAAEVHPITTDDGVDLRLTRYRGGAKGPVMLVPGTGTTARAFAIDTVDVNLAEFLCAAGYDVWLFDHRASPAVAAGREQCTLDDIALYDHPAAIAEIRAATGAESIQVVAHCVGSATLLMSIAAGKATAVRSAICSQFTMHVDTTAVPWLKSALRVGTILRSFGIERLDVRYDTGARWTDRLYDALLRLYPSRAGERCANPVCRRIRFIWGETFRHEMLNYDTHRLLSELFGESNMSLLRHVSTVVRKGHAVDHAGRNVYLPRVDRMAIPITFVHGAHNTLFLPSGSERTCELLSAANGAGLYERTVFPDYAHMDLFIGKRAHRDVFPYFVQRLDRCNRINHS